MLEDRRKRAIAEYKCDAYADYRDMLKRKTLIGSKCVLSYACADYTGDIESRVNVLCEPWHLSKG